MLCPTRVAHSSLFVPSIKNGTFTCLCTFQDNLQDEGREGVLPIMRIVQNHDP